MKKEKKRKSTREILSSANLNLSTCIRGTSTWETVETFSGRPRRRRGQSACGSSISSRAVSDSPIFCGRNVNSSLKRRGVQNAFPETRPVHDHPPILVANPWDTSGHESTSLVLPLFYSRISFSTHDIFPSSSSSCQVSSCTRKPAPEWLNGNRSEMERPPACHSRSCALRLTHPVAPVMPERWFPATNYTRRHWWLSWLKPFWLSRGTVIMRGELNNSLSLKELAADKWMRGGKLSLYYWHSVLLRYYFAFHISTIYVCDCIHEFKLIVFHLKFCQKSK